MPEWVLISLYVLGLGTGAYFYSVWARDRVKKRGPRTVVVDYSDVGLGKFYVTAVACCGCRNAFFVQHIHFEKPKCCPYCKTEFMYAEPAGDDEMRQILVPDSN